RGHVRVIERGEDARFPLEADEELGVPGERAPHHLQRDLASEPAVVRAEDLAHPPGAEGSEDVVRADPHAGREAHLESLTKAHEFCTTDADVAGNPAPSWSIFVPIAGARFPRPT